MRETKSRVDDHVPDKGWFIIPCRGKEPTIKWKELTKQPDIPNGSNYGIVTGKRNNIFVVDCDRKKPKDPDNYVDGEDMMDEIIRNYNDGEEWDTPKVRTGSGGTHYFFKYNDELAKQGTCKVSLKDINAMGEETSLTAKIDTRSNGGYVIGPGSIHPDTGRKYEWYEDFTPEDREPAELPEPLRKLLLGTHELERRSGKLRLIEKQSRLAGIPADERARNSEDEPKISLDMLQRIVMGLDKKRAYDRDSWRDVVWAIHNCVGEDGLDIAIEFSKQAKEKYAGATDVSNTMRDTNGSIKIGSLWRWLKLDNPSLFEELQQEQRISRIEEKKVTGLKDAYYLMDFINTLASNFWESEAKLHAEFKEHVGRALFRTYGGFEWYIKLNKKERFMPLRKLPKDKISYMKINSEGELVPKTIEFSKLADELINSVPKYDRTVFIPLTPTEECIEQGRDMNIWPGFEAQLVEQVDLTKVQPILDHIRIVWASENQTHYEYLMAWIRHVIMKPWEKTRVAVVLRSGKHQIGKGLIADNFLRKLVFGEDIGYYDKGLDFLTQRFNEPLMSKIFVVADELTSMEGNGYHATFDAMKSMITCSTMGIEIKGGRKFNAESYINMMLLTNNQFSVKVEAGDRRYFILDCDERYADNTAYFDHMLENYINQDCANHFITYMSQYKTSVNLRDIPVTKLKEEMIEQNLNSGERFVNKVKEVKGYFLLMHQQEDDIEELSGVEAEMAKFETERAKNVYEVYVRWCQSIGEKAMNLKTFGLTVKSKVDSKKMNYGMIYMF
jgi:hypothetical protein